MTDDEAKTFFKEVIRGIWSKWNPSELDTSLWLAILRQCKKDESEASLRRWYANTDRTTYKPVPGHIRKLLVYEHREENQPKEPRKEFGLQRLEGGKTTWFFINSGRKRDPRQIEEDSEKARLRAEELYGGEWVIIQPPQPQPDDGLRGEPALREAERRILAGPDSPGRRFLQRLGRSVTHNDIFAVLGKPDDGIPI